MTTAVLTTRTTPTPEATLLRWLDGTDGDDHAAMSAANWMTARALEALNADLPCLDDDDVRPIVAYVLMALRDADAEAAR